jgi:hypothetical protein
MFFVGMDLMFIGIPLNVALGWKKLIFGIYVCSTIPFTCTYSCCYLHDGGNIFNRRVSFLQINMGAFQKKII